METYNPVASQSKMVLVTEEGLANLISSLLPPAIHQGIKDFKLEEIQEKYVSADEGRKLFNPALSRPTFESYAEKGYYNKYYLGGRTWFKYSEILAALKTIKKYGRQNLVNQ
jgi:hypothetical protein